MSFSPYLCTSNLAILLLSLPYKPIFAEARESGLSPINSAGAPRREGFSDQVVLLTVGA